MPAPDRASGLADELHALPVRDRRAILAALSPFERAQLERLLDGAPPPPPAPPVSPYSPWLAERIAEAAAGAGPLTPAVRRLVAEAAVSGAAPAAAVPVPQGRSLLGALGSFLKGAPR